MKQDNPEHQPYQDHLEAARLNEVQREEQEYAGSRWETGRTFTNHLNGCRTKLKGRPGCIRYGWHRIDGKLVEIPPRPEGFQFRDYPFPEPEGEFECGDFHGGQIGAHISPMCDHEECNPENRS